MLQCSQEQQHEIILREDLVIKWEKTLGDNGKEQLALSLR
ncbi:hypothetical protein NIES3275_58710 [Microchaete diplosiphon NIES-3275]|nr:hypothetical protein NIES3275_58710 [Microchaete diplosiphon NIES-3275]